MVENTRFTDVLEDGKKSSLFAAPAAPAAEQALLWSLIARGYDDCDVELILLSLKATDFYSQRNRMVFEAIAELFERNIPPDLLTLRDCLTRRGDLEDVGGIDYLMELAENTPSTANVEYYSNEVRHKAALRHIIQASHTIRDECLDAAADPQEIIERAEATILSTTSDIIQNDTTSAEDITGDVLAQILNRRAGELRGLPTGFADLDDKTHGLKGGEMTIVAARTSMGKTALMLNMVEHIAVDKNVPVAIFSLEMTDSALIERMLSSRAGVDLHTLSSGLVDAEAEQRLRIAGEEINAAQIHIASCRDLTALSLRTKARRLVRQKGVKLIIVDYLQLVRSAGGQRQDRYLQIGEISRSLKALAVELDVAVLALSQLNRSSESREGHRPRISDLRESGNIEQDADVVMLIHRPGYHDKSEPDNIAELIIGKNRNGPVGSVSLKWTPRSARFENNYTSFGENS